MCRFGWIYCESKVPESGATRCHLSDSEKLCFRILSDFIIMFQAAGKNLASSLPELPELKTLLDAALFQLETKAHE